MRMETQNVTIRETQNESITEAPESPTAPTSAAVSNRQAGAGATSPATANPTPNPQPDAAKASGFSYLDCLRGITPVPRNVNGATLFQMLMVGGMVTFMVTVNGLRNTGFDFLVNSHWLYPLMFCLAFLVRTYISGPLANRLAPRLVLGRFQGVARSIGMTVLNVLCTAPIMCALATLLIVGTDDYLMHYLATLPIVAPLAALVNYFIVGPIAKMLFFNKISPASGLGLLGNLEAHVPNIARLLGC